MSNELIVLSQKNKSKTHLQGRMLLNKNDFTYKVSFLWFTLTTSFLFFSMDIIRP